MEKADFHGHPLLHPEYLPTFSLDSYATLSMALGITLPPITNFGEEDRLSAFYEEPLLLRNFDKERFREGFIVYGFDKRAIFLRSQEVPTKDGHVLLVGASHNLQLGNRLEETLREAKDENALIIADHPFISSFRGGIGRRNLERYREYFDGIELNAQATDMLGKYSFGIFRQRENNEYVLTAGKELQIPIVANSDFHMSYAPGVRYFHGGIDDFGKTYNEFTKPLGFKRENFVDNIRRMLHQGDYTRTFTYTTPQNLIRWHIGMGLSKLLKKR